ncbi:hypothetical protein [Streptosporangium lutulentum]|uniref:Uncharacterized protein n=1 Tax=Streptosporangium lutulentum TaxID=1461250 RepID=A0ABT9Q309_9ACTN|nr:hypothetical protein [Streptosporangium lutulentum]MDP9841112.1 hypothetical protein [Streptosporangium lutulentum]
MSHFIDSYAIGGLATIYLLYNGSTNCVVTWKSSKYQGIYSTTGASIQKQGGERIHDTDFCMSYAGTCVSWGGVASNGAGSGDSRQSGWTHCG